jgi:hypothetical protein
MIVTRLLAARSGRDWHAAGVSAADRPEITGIR